MNADEVIWERIIQIMNQKIESEFEFKIDVRTIHQRISQVKSTYRSFSKHSGMLEVISFICYQTPGQLGEISADINDYPDDIQANSFTSLRQLSTVLLRGVLSRR